MLKSSIRIVLEIYILDNNARLSYKSKYRLREIVNMYLARCQNSYSFFMDLIRKNMLYSSNSKEYRLFSDFYHYLLTIYADDCKLTVDK